MPDKYTFDYVMSFPEMKERYAAEYPAYQTKTAAVQATAPLIKDAAITIVLGTWCGDSQRELPRFYKILDELDFPKDRVTLICVDEMKNEESGLTDTLNINRIPAFIFSNGATETGRITESPMATLEEDMVEILTQK